MRMLQGLALAMAVMSAEAYAAGSGQFTVRVMYDNPSAKDLQKIRDFAASEPSLAGWEGRLCMKDSENCETLYTTRGWFGGGNPACDVIMDDFAMGCSGDGMSAGGGGVTVISGTGGPVMGSNGPVSAGGPGTMPTAVSNTATSVMDFARAITGFEAGIELKVTWNVKANGDYSGSVELKVHGQKGDGAN